jgi:hypothetical protein
MKPIIIANVVAAVVLVLLGYLAVAAHHAHAFSVYEELKGQRVLVERPDYNVERRLRTIAGGGTNALIIAWLAAVACLANAVAVAVLWPRSRREGEPGASPNCGTAAPPGNSGVTEGPPSVS